MAGASKAAPAKRSTSVRIREIREVVDYDEEKHQDEIQEDIKRGIAHPEADPLNELEERVNDLGDSWENASVFAEALEELIDERPEDMKDG
jgi:rRNA maturation endonuclease Nob1